MFKTLTVLLIGGLLTIQSAWADDSAKLVGTWKLIAFETEFQDGSPPRPIFGKNPVGYGIAAAWAPDAALPGTPMTRGVLKWVRSK